MYYQLGQVLQITAIITSWGVASAAQAIQKAQFSIFFLNGENLERQAAQEQHFKIQFLNLWMNCEKVCPNFGLLFKMRWDNHIKIDGHILNLT